MKYTILKYGMLAGALLFGGCSNWLDVDPKSQVKQEALFESEAGFQDALTGIYTMMARTGMYGGHETMGFLDMVAQTYTEVIYTYEDVLKYNYEETNSKACIDGFWEGNYSAIANCNQILAHVDERKGVFSSGVYEAVKAEALALRAFLHFDLLRGFAFSYVTGKDELAIPYYGVAVKGEYDRIAPFDFFDATGSYVAWFYDQGRERFIYLNCPLQGDVMIELQDMSGAFNPNNVGMQMLWGGAFGSNNKLNNGRMVMEDDAGERWMLSFTSSKVDNQVVFTPLAKIQLTYEGAREAHTFTTAQNANFLYYGYDNKIACVSFSTGNLLNVYEMEGGNVDYIECDQVGNINQMWVGISDGSGTAKSGSIVVLEMSTDGSLKEVTRYKNVCGKVVDFEYKQ